ncbi:hypothetical protein KQI41_00540 [Tissierella pigra]|uniref:DUF2089 domain-containing protein n=1 Tax=Tissierella pigra TaxID=2607614 RepID=A0A6N7XZG7_9FIRM|nr:hypothetical protein [Tissierella pigra]MBU5424880.1 hypothetical protein [Tissierella pigra]MSU01180.1 DUF2089 domain-containing protein [Tissierella pigra]
MKSKKLFRFITGLWIGFGVLPLTLIILKLAYDGNISSKALTLFLLGLVIIGIIIVGICKYVYKDAKERGMDPYLWMATAAYVPNLVGLIVYIVMRKQFSPNIERLRCESCSTEVKGDWKYCPNCSNKLSKSK